jgi:hypothetical protein
LYPYPFIRRPYIIQILQKKTETTKKNPSTHAHSRTRNTRAHGTRVPETGTGMKRIGYGFEKKLVYPCPPYPSTYRVYARPTRHMPQLCPARTRGTR